MTAKYERILSEAVACANNFKHSERRYNDALSELSNAKIGYDLNKKLNDNAHNVLKKYEKKLYGNDI